MNELDLEQNVARLLVAAEEEQPALRKAAFDVYQMDRTFIDIDRSFEYVGDNSRYQQRVTLILSLQWVLFSFMVMCMSFFFKKPSFHCDRGGGFMEECAAKEACRLMGLSPDLVTVDMGRHVSISERFGLYCGKEIYEWWAQSGFFLGGFLSGFVVPFLNEWLGRKKAMLGLVLASAGSVILCGLAPSIELVVFFYLSAGFFLFGYETSVHVFISEISGARFRNISINVLAMVWALSPIFFSFVTIFFDHYSQFFLYVIGAPLLLSALLNYFFFFESPRYLLSKRQYAEVRRIFRRISLINRRQPYDFRLQEEMEEANRRYDTFGKKGRGGAEEELDTSSSLQVGLYPALGVLSLCWGTRYLVYFGITIAMESITTSYFVNLWLLSLSEVLAALLITPFKLRFSNRSILLGSLAVLVFASLVMLLTPIPEHCTIKDDAYCGVELVSLAMSMVQRFAVTCFSSALITYGGAAFPVRIRSYAYAMTMNLGRAVTPCIPFIIDLVRTRYPERNPLGVLGLASLLNLVLAANCLKAVNQ